MRIAHSQSNCTSTHFQYANQKHSSATKTIDPQDRYTHPISKHAHILLLFHVTEFPLTKVTENFVDNMSPNKVLKLPKVAESCQKNSLTICHRLAKIYIYKDYNSSTSFSSIVNMQSNFPILS